MVHNCVEAREMHSRLLNTILVYYLMLTELKTVDLQDTLYIDKPLSELN